jgi:hypothetical protein
MTLDLLYGLYYIFILLLLEFHSQNNGVQLLGERNGKGHLLPKLEVPLICYMLHMDVGRSTSTLGKCAYSVSPKIWQKHVRVTM